MGNIATNQKQIYNENIGHRKRLREKLLSSKTNSYLHKHEILEILLFYTNTRKDTKSIAKSILQKYGSLRHIFNASMSELKIIPGVGEASATLIKCIKHLFEFILQEEILENPVINNWKKLIEYISIRIGSSRTEKSMSIYLNKKNMVINETIQETGTIDQTPLYIREILREALILDASSIIITHNHPSGDPKPSSADQSLTMKLQQGCEFMGLNLIDHVIVSNNKSYSFKSNGLL